jgi:hypothetical protein
MEPRIALAASINATPEAIYEVVRTSEGLRSFWTSDCDVTDTSGRFGFAQASVDLQVTVSSTPNELVSMTVNSGFPGWSGSTWSWRLTRDAERPGVTNVQFRHVDFEENHAEDAVAFTAQTWAMVLDHLVRFMESGVPKPFFANEAG